MLNKTFMTQVLFHLKAPSSSLMFMVTSITRYSSDRYLMATVKKAKQRRFCVAIISEFLKCFKKTFVTRVLFQLRAPSSSKLFISI